MAGVGPRCRRCCQPLVCALIGVRAAVWLARPAGETTGSDVLGRLAVDGSGASALARRGSEHAMFHVKQRAQR